MNSPQIQYKTIISSFTKGEKPCYYAQVIHNGTNYRDDMVTKVASRGGIGKETVDYVLSLFFSQLRDEFKDGMRLEMEDLAGNLSVQGGFPTKDGVWDPLVNQLVPNLHAKGNLGSCLVGQTAVNVTEGAKVILKSVLDTVLKTESVLVTGTNVTVYAAGSGLITSTDPTSGEGCWLENCDTGVVSATGTVTASTATTLNATFATMPPVGTYWFVVASRGGLGPEFGVAQAKRKVTVVAATTAENGGN